MKEISLDYARVLVEELHDIQKGDLEKLLKQFVQFLEEKGDDHLIHEIVSALEIAWKEKFGAASIEVSTAYEMSKELSSKLEQIANGASLTSKTDRELIGGARIRIDDRIIDSTTKSHLDSLKTTLLSA